MASISPSKNQTLKIFSTPKKKESKRGSSGDNLSLPFSDNNSSCNLAEEHKEFTP